jgi:hypothetical protein
MIKWTREKPIISRKLTAIVTEESSSIHTSTACLLMPVDLLLVQHQMGLRLALLASKSFVREGLPVSLMMSVKLK